MDQIVIVAIISLVPPGYPQIIVRADGVITSTVSACGIHSEAQLLLDTVSAQVPYPLEAYTQVQLITAWQSFT